MSDDSRPLIPQNSDDDAIFFLSNEMASIGPVGLPGKICNCYQRQTRDLLTAWDQRLLQ